MSATSNTEEKSLTLTPSWKHFFLSYLLSILAIPLAGIGFIALYFVRKKHTDKKYVVTDTLISSVDNRYTKNVDIINISDVEMQRNWLQQKLGVGTLILRTSATTMHLEGIENPDRVKNILETAIKAQAKKAEEAQKRKPREPDFKPGSMDKMEYLTGLWQQGLISEEDYEKEKKHFE